VDGKKKNLVCEIESCNNFVSRRTLCSTHYNKQLPKKQCILQDCTRAVKAKSLCRKHYYQQYPNKIWKPSQVCTVQECTNIQFASKFCSKQNPEVRKRKKALNRLLYYKDLQKSRAKHRIYGRTPKRRFSMACWQAKKRGLAWSISYEDYIVLTQNVCYYCSDVLPLVGCGLDRVDNNKGYETANVVPCCRQCNEVKGDRFSKEETKVIMNALRVYRQATAAAENPEIPRVQGGDNTAIPNSEEEVVSSTTG
jgi:hypothetical protein